MKLNLIQFMAFAFMLGWIGTDILNGANIFGVFSYSERISTSVFFALMVGYLNNAHGIAWGWVKKTVGEKA